MPNSYDAAKPEASILGIDVAKHHVVLYDSVRHTTHQIDNHPAALVRALRRYRHYDLAVCETTGGFERALCEAATQVGLPMHRAHASCVKAYIASHGQGAKTDAIDAGWLARYGQERGSSLPRWQAPNPSHEALAHLIRHRQNLVKQRTQVRNQLQAPNGQILSEWLTPQIEFLSRQIESLDQQIAEQVRQHNELAERAQVLASIKGLGPVSRTTLLALLPELGHLTAKQASSLCGLAPHANDSGQRRGYRRMRPGRQGLRPVLFMAALAAARSNPKLRGFYQGLIQRGKPKRLALAAVARKLVVIANARLREHELGLT
jgi:transposase